MEAELGIGEAARSLGLTVDTLRYYERAGLLDGVPRTEGNQRRYGAQSLDVLRFVTKLRASGMPIRIIKRYVALLPQGAESADARRQILEEHRAAVQARMDELAGHLEILDLKITLYTHGVHPKSDHPCARALEEKLNGSKK